MYCVFVCKRARVAVKAQSVVSSPLPHEFQDLTSGCKAWPRVLCQLSICWLGIDDLKTVHFHLHGFVGLRR